MSIPQEHRSAPIFVIGSPRSGTSILTWCLGQHSNILPSEESDWIGPFAQQVAAHHAIGSARGERSQLSALGVDSVRFMRRFGATIDRLILEHRHMLERNADAVARSDPGQVVEGFAVSRGGDEPKQRWVDGTPEYSLHVEGLHRLFPDAQFVHIARDVDQVVASLLNFRNNDGSPLVNSEEEAYERWWRCARACLQAEHALGVERVYRLRYQDLIERPDEALRDVLAFLGEPFESTCVEPLATRINSSGAEDGTPHTPANPSSPTIVEARNLSDKLQQRRPEVVASERARRQQAEDFEERVGHARALPANYQAVLCSLEQLEDATGSTASTLPGRSGVGQHARLGVLQRRLNWCGALFVLQCLLALLVMFSNLDMSTLKGQIDVLWFIVSIVLLASYLWMRRAGVMQVLARLRGTH